MSTVTIRRWIPRILALAIVGGGLAALIIYKPWSSGPTPITFTTVAVGKGTIAAQVTANGTLSARGTVTVGAQVSGRVVEIHADFNDKVKKGQIIAKLDEQVLKAQIDQQSAAYALAAANVSKAQVALDDGERQLKRQKSLQDQQLVAGATVEAAQVAYDRLSLACARLAAAWAWLARAASSAARAVS